MESIFSQVPTLVHIVCVGLVAQSCQTLATPWTVACQAPLSMGFSRKEYWSGLPIPAPGDLPDPGIEPRSPALQADSLPTELQGKPLVHIKIEEKRREQKWAGVDQRRVTAPNPGSTI